MRVPFIECTLHGGNHSCLRRGVLKRLGIPVCERTRHRRAVGRAAQQRQDAGAMVRKVGVNAHPPFITTAIRAGDVVPQFRRGSSLNAEVALTAKLCRGVAHIDAHLLKSPRARLPDGVRGAGARSDRGLRRGANPKRRRQRWIMARELDRGQRLERKTNRIPQVNQDRRGILHRQLRTSSRRHIW
jgi:hypothetical protein